jgi:hypothetical protein
MYDNIYQTSASTGTPAQSTAGQGGFVGPGLDLWHVWPNAATASTLTNYTANRLNCIQFYLDRTVTINHLSFYLGTAAGTTATANFGIYDATGTIKLFDSGPLNVNATGSTTYTQPASSFVTPSGVALVLPAGTYWYVFACTVSATVALLSLPGPGTSQPTFISSVAQRVGMSGAGNVLSAGVLPSAIGTLSQPDISYPLAAFLP